MLGGSRLEVRRRVIQGGTCEQRVDELSQTYHQLRKTSALLYLIADNDDLILIQSDFVPHFSLVANASLRESLWP